MSALQQVKNWLSIQGVKFSNNSELGQFLFRVCLAEDWEYENGDDVYAKFCSLDSLINFATSFGFKMK